MSKSSILSILALVASALGLNHNDNVASAQLANKVAKFKKDHALGEDESNALGAVLRAAETAPVSADSTRAAEVTKEHLPDAEEAAKHDDLEDTKPGTRPLEKGDLGTKAPVPAKPVAPLGSQSAGPTNEPGAKGVEGEAGAPK